jgi:tRNA uridine 5-carbamoylmethylation protein Kti12
LGFVTPKLVLFTGPVASGKTTLARDLAARVRATGIGAAAIDMDDLVFMVNGFDWRTVTATHWAVARQAAAALIDALLSARLDLVTVAGPFFGESERDDLISHVRAAAAVHVVALDVTLQEAVIRAQADPSRTLSKDPVLLASLENTINWAELPTDAIRVSTDGLPADVVGGRIFRALFDSG